MANRPSLHGKDDLTPGIEPSYKRYTTLADSLSRYQLLARIVDVTTNQKLA